MAEHQHLGRDLLERLLARTHLCRPSDVADVVADEAARALGASGVVLYRVNREQTALVPLPAVGSPPRGRQLVAGTLAGRAFTSSGILSAPGDTPGRRRVFVPLLDGTDRVGLMELVVTAQNADLPHELQRVLERFAHATAQTLVVKSAYGDDLELAQRSRTMDLGAELVWSVLPPLTFATDNLVITAMLEPAYENGGDAFDYAVNADVTHLAVFDGLGHGLPAAHLSTFAIGAYRHSRRSGLGLVDTYRALDHAITEQFANEPFVRLLPEEGKNVNAVGQDVLEALRGYDERAELRRTEVVGAQVGKELAEQGALAALFAFLLILIYVGFRFQWMLGVGSIMAALHDPIIILGIFSATQWTFDLPTLASVLAVVGYSLNDTVVVFDRIRENLRRYKRADFKTIINMSVNQTLSRTVMTSGTTALAILPLLIYGGSVLENFTVGMLFGILIGTFSSVYVAASLLLYMRPLSPAASGDGETEVKGAKSPVA